VFLLCVMCSSTTAERQSLASRDRTCCLRRCLPARPLRFYGFRGSMAHPHNRCVRFAPAVAGDHATLATGRPLRPTRTGLSPAGPRQLSWRTSNPWSSKERMDCFVASLAMTERHGVSTARPTSLPCCRSISASLAFASGIGVTGIGPIFLARTRSSSSCVSRKLPT